MEDEKDAFYVVRKGDVIGVYKSFADCQAQASLSPLDPSISVYKGYGLSKEAESYLVSRGLKQVSLSIGAAEVQDELFGALSVCRFQDAVGSSSVSVKQPDKLQNLVDSRPSAPASVGAPATYGRIQKQQSCTIEFDGASKGNPGLSGAGVILRSTDGCEVWRLREGVGIATSNVAEYRSVILGLKTALQKGFKHVHVRGDSLLVSNQILGKWKTKNENMANLCKEALELKKQFATFTIEQVPREFNSDADAQANRAIHLRDGQVETEVATR